MILRVNDKKISIKQCVQSFENENTVFISAILPMDGTLDYNEVHKILLENNFPTLVVDYENDFTQTFTGFYFSTLTLNHEEDGRVEMVCSFRNDVVNTDTEE